jgi:hypothetical protein
LEFSGWLVPDAGQKKRFAERFLLFAGTANPFSGWVSPSAGQLLFAALSILEIMMSIEIFRLFLQKVFGFPFSI